MSISNIHSSAVIYIELSNRLALTQKTQYRIPFVFQLFNTPYLFTNANEPIFKYHFIIVHFKGELSLYWILFYCEYERWVLPFRILMPIFMNLRFIFNSSVFYFTIWIHFSYNSLIFKYNCFVNFNSNLIFSITLAYIKLL